MLPHRRDHEAWYKAAYLKLSAGWIDRDPLGGAWVKIYEVTTPEEAFALARVGIDHIGVLVGDGTFPRELPI
jgi:hypothetical protein